MVGPHGACDERRTILTDSMALHFDESFTVDVALLSSTYGA